MQAANSEDLRVWLNSRRFLRAEQQVLQSDTGLKHFKFCYTLSRTKELARAKHVLLLVAQQKGIFSPLPISYLFLHLETANTIVNVQDFPPFIIPFFLESWKYSKKGWFCWVEYFVGFGAFYTLCGVDLLSWNDFCGKIFHFFHETKLFFYIFILHFTAILDWSMFPWRFISLMWAFRCWIELTSWFGWWWFFSAFLIKFFTLELIFSLFSLLATFPEVMHDFDHKSQFSFSL